MTGNAPSFLLLCTQAVLAHRQQILATYEPHDLHQFRVHIRRIRALMKYVPACQDRLFRQAWKEYFTVTNAARDWDEFDVAAKSLLSHEHWMTIQLALRQHPAREHEKVRTMLDSPGWHQHIRNWQSFISNLCADLQDSETQLGTRVVTEAVLAQTRALTEDTPVAWHRFRIAIKNLRYVAAIPRQAGHSAATSTSLIESCERIQDVLGDWHDCTIQLDLIRSTAVQAGLARVCQGQEIADLLVAGLKDRQLLLLEQAKHLRLELPANYSALAGTA